MPGAMPFGLKIAVINREFRKKMDEKAAAMGLTSVQLRVLGTISRLEAAGKEEIHQKDLEKIERVTHPAMTRLLQRLESKDLSAAFPASGSKVKAITCTISPARLQADLGARRRSLSGLVPEFHKRAAGRIARLTDLILQGVDSL